MINLNIDNNAIGSQIKTARKNKNYTQENLAEHLGVSITYVSKIERGDTRINLETLVKICNYLDVSPAYILNNSICTSESYLRNEITDMLRDCSPEKIRLIANVIKSIIEFRE